MSSTDQTGRMGVHIAGTEFENLGLAFRAQEVSDFGIDAHVEPREGARGTGQLLAIQIKAGESYSRVQTDSGWWVQTDQSHADYWAKHSLPVLLVKVDVDARVAYWQSVTPETVVSTGKGRKILIPKNQKVNKDSLPKLLDLLTPIVPPSRYTIVQERDVSHGLAKRYSYEIVLNGTLSKAQIATVVRGVTSRGRTNQYHRNRPSRDRWQGQEADVVWTLVYPSAEDRARSNWICRSQWISPKLAEDARPIVFEGENVGDDICVDWKPDYSSLSATAAEQTLDKRDFLDAILPMIGELEQLLKTYGDSLEGAFRDRIDLERFRSETAVDRNRIQELYRISTALDLAPYECAEVDQRFQEFSAFMDNMAMVHTDRGLETWSAKNGMYLAQQARKDAQEKLVELRYELKKVR